MSVYKIVTAPGGVLPVSPVNIVINCPAPRLRKMLRSGLSFPNPLVLSS